MAQKKAKKTIENANRSKASIKKSNDQSGAKRSGVALNLSRNRLAPPYVSGHPKDASLLGVTQRLGVHRFSGPCVVECD